MTRDIVLITGNKIFWKAIGMNTIIRKRLGRGWLHIFMERNPLLTMRPPQIIKRVRAKASVNCIQ